MVILRVPFSFPDVRSTQFTSKVKQMKPFTGRRADRSRIPETLYELTFESLESRQLLAVGLASTDSRYLSTPADRWIPNFAESSSFRSVCEESCFWDEPTSWSANRVPTASDRVIIDPADQITIRNASAVAETVTVDVDGSLRFAPNVVTQLKVETLTVLGELEIGTESVPIDGAVTATITFVDTPIDLQEDPGQYGHGLLALHHARIRMHGHELDETFLRLAHEPLAGDTTLVLEQAPQGWREGDGILLPDTRHLKTSEKPQNGNYSPQWEELTITQIEGAEITLNRPLQFDHWGARDAEGNLEFLPHVANRSRNIILQSENPLGMRAHTLFQGRSDIDVRYAAFMDLGRTRNVELNNTAFATDGQATRIGKNQVARYPIHTHHLAGPIDAQANGHQFTLIGNAVDNGSLDHNFKWGIAIHASHYGLIQNNVVYNVAGSAVVTEDGTESFNHFDRNFAMRSRSSGSGWRFSLEDGNHSAREATGFWFRGPNNYVTDNVATNILSFDQPDTAYGFKYLFRYLGTQKIPAFQGAMAHMNGIDVNLNALPILEFSGNEAYGAIESGLTYWWVGAIGGSPQAEATESIIQDFRVWHAFNKGIFHYPASKITVDGLTVRGSHPDESACCSVGFYPDDYMAKNLVIRHADIQGMRTGIDLPKFSRGATVVEDSYLRNARANIKVNTHFSVNGSQGHPAKSAVIRNVRFAASDDQVNNIAMSFNNGGNTHLTQTDEVYVYDYNGIPGDDFQVYYRQQHPDFVVPQSGSQERLAGSPENGLTNQQNWEKYGIAIAGRVAPSLAQREAISGYVGEISTINKPIANRDEREVKNESPRLLRGNVLANDFDLDGQALTVVKINGDPQAIDQEYSGQFGTLSLASDGSYEYQLDRANATVRNMGVGDQVTESFLYTISDGELINTTSLTIDIRRTKPIPPFQANPDSGFLSTRNPLASTNGNVLSNDSNPGIEELAVNAVNGSEANVGQTVTGKYGNLQLQANGVYTYQLNLEHPDIVALDSGQQLIDPFNYQIANDFESSTAQLSIRIKNGSEINRAPTPKRDELTISSDDNQLHTVNVITNDIDIDGDELKVSAVYGSPNLVGLRLDSAFGNFRLTEDGSFEYQLNSSHPDIAKLRDGDQFFDAVAYSVTDGELQEQQIILISISGVTPENKPNAGDDFVAIFENDSLGVITGNLIENDRDPNGDPLHVVKVNDQSTSVGNPISGQYGSLFVEADGQYVYELDNQNPFVDQLDDDDRLFENFTYTISDGISQANALLNVTINGVRDNSAPMANADTLAIVRDRVAGGVDGEILDNDFEPEGQIMSVAELDGRLVQGATFSIGDYGLLVVNDEGMVRYVLNETHPDVLSLTPSGTLEESFAYQLSDGILTDDSTITVIIYATHLPPNATQDIATIEEDADRDTIVGSLLTNDSDPNDSDLALTHVNGSSTLVGETITGDYGTLSINSDGRYVYQLDNSISAVDQLDDGESLVERFSYSISNGFHHDESELLIIIQGRTDPRVLGDSNGDGIFDSSDLIAVFRAGEYEDDIENNSTFEEGDWNGDGDFDSSDLIAALQASEYVSRSTSLQATDAAFSALR